MTDRFSACAALVATLTFSSAFAQPEQTSDSVDPESATQSQQHNLVRRDLVNSDNWMVTAAHPLASQVGAEILAQGGNAIDAMVAVQLMLGLVEPQSSGIGGGSFLVYWDAKKQTLTTFDGRETAPRKATSNLFLDRNNQPMGFFDAVVGGRSVGTPGTIMLLWQTHQQHGQLDWQSVIKPVIQRAKQGFTISPRLASLIERDKARLATHPATARYFLTDSGAAKPQGTVLQNPAYAATLERIAKQGADGFYQGQVANNIVAAVQRHSNPGVLTTDDLAQYQVIERQAVCAPYFEYQVCGMGPPSSGALTVGQILMISAEFDLATWGIEDPRSWQVIGDASRLAFSDRGQYIADPDFTSVPTQGLLDKDYLKQRAALITSGTALKQALPGEPPWPEKMARLTTETQERPSTTHFNIVDAKGNVVSMTSSVENAFGSRVMVDGFLLNNQLTDFAFSPEYNGKQVANRLEPGKRPRSSMAPTIVLRSGQPYLAIGSPGGSRIIGYVAQSLIAHTQWGLDIQQAINLPHLNNRFGRYDLERDTDAEQWHKPLQKMGFKTHSQPLNSGIHVIRLINNQLEGAADPRREGVAIGE